MPLSWIERITTPLEIATRADTVEGTGDRLARLARGAAPIVVDPSLADGVRPPARGAGSRSVAEGPWGAVLKRWARDARVSFEVYGFRELGEQDAERSRAWVRVCKRGDEGEASTLSHVLEWCKGLMRKHDPAWNAACARALASLDWPAAIVLLEERWVVDGQVPALSGLLHAAGRGRVSPALAQVDNLRSVLVLPLTGSEPVRRAERLGRALLNLSPFAVDGTPLTPLLLERWDALTPAERWVRFVALEGQGIRDGQAARRARAVLTDAEAPFYLRRQAARALEKTRARGERVVVERGLSALFEHEPPGGTLPRILAAAGADPPALGARAWLSLDDAEARLAFCEWSLAAGAQDVAAATFEAALEGGAVDVNTLASRLRSWVGNGQRGPTGAMLETLRSAATDDAGRELLTELALRAGVADPEARRAFFDAQLAARAQRPADPTVLRRIACVAADPALGAAARAAIVEALVDGVPARALRPAVELAQDELLRARADADRELFLATLRREAGRTGHDLTEQLYARDWPPEAGVEPRRLDHLDHHLRSP
ncbi:MAG: hypothetical protein GY711_32135 [bacterium]|nr:hypothetical protein [bacterium]